MIDLVVACTTILCVLVLIIAISVVVTYFAISSMEFFGFLWNVFLKVIRRLCESK